MVFDAGCRNHHSVMGEVSLLELLDHLGRKVSNIASCSKSGVSESSATECSCEKLIIKLLVASELSVQKV